MVRSGHGAGRRSRPWAATGALIGFMLMTSPPAHAETNRSIVPAKAALAVTVGADPVTTTVLATSAITRIDANASPGISVTLGDKADQACKADNTTATLAKHTGVASVSVCATADTPTSGTIVLVASDGSTATIAVTASCPAADPPPPTSPSKVTVAVNEPSGSKTLRPGFTVPKESTAIAGGPNDTAEVVLAPGPKAEEADGDYDPCATVAAPSGVTVRVSGANEIGTYSASFDLNGDADGGSFEVSVVRRVPGENAIFAALLGIVIAALLTAKTGKLTDQAARVQKMHAMRAANARRASFLATISGPSAALVNVWLPNQWKSFQKRTTTPDPDLDTALDLYGQATEAGSELLALAQRLQADGYGESHLFATVMAEIDKGVLLTGTETPSDAVGRLQVAAADARKVRLAWERNPDAEGRRILARKSLTIAAEGLPAVEQFGPATAADDETKRKAVSTTPPAPIVITGIDDLTWSLRIQRWGLFAVTSLLAAAVNVGSAIDPTTAWGTIPDYFKVIGATAALPAIVEQVRKATTLSRAA